MALSANQLEQLWIQNGGSPGAAQTAAAVALAESGGDPNSHATSGEDSRGLWQINVAPSANPVYGSLNLYDPATNVKVAIKMSNNGANWQPWTTFTSGKYKSFLGQTSPSNAIGGAAVSPLGALGALPQAAGVSVPGPGDIVSAIVNVFNQAISDLKYGVVLLLVLGVGAAMMFQGFKGARA